MNNKQNLIFVGGGGHSLSCADIVSQQNFYNLIGFTDPNKNSLLSKKGLSWLGSDDNLEHIFENYKNAFIALGHTRQATLRISAYKKCKNLGFSFPILKSSYSYVSSTANVDEGTLIMNGVVINAYAQVKKNCIINSNAVIEHGAKIGNHVHVAPSAIILGDVNIEDKCFIGAGAIIKEGKTIKNGTYIKAREIVK